jgi:hypothetical protein
MARYRVLAKSFINNRIVEEGEEIDYDPGPKGHASANLEAVKGKKAKAEGAGSSRRRSTGPRAGLTRSRFNRNHEGAAHRSRPFCLRSGRVASSVDIANLALAHLGDEAAVTSFDPPDGSAQAEHCARLLPDRARRLPRSPQLEIRKR